MSLNRTFVPYLPQHCREHARSRREKPPMETSFAALRRLRTALPKQRADEPGRRDLRHRRLHFHRHLIVANLERYRADGRAGFRTRRLLQILHGPPSLRIQFSDADKLRPRTVEVKWTPQHLVVCCTRNTTASISYSFPVTSMVGPAMTEGVVFRRASTAYPRLSHRNSTAFCTRPFSRIPQKIHLFFAGFAHHFRVQYQQSRRTNFHQLFRVFSTRKKGEKQAESKICGKTDFSGLDHHR